jgi:hypothetical protein
MLAFGSCRRQEKVVGGYSEQFAKLLDCESCVTNDSTHGEGIHRVVARNRKDALAVRHDDMFTLPQNAESSPLQGPNSVKVGDSWKLAH